MDIVNPKVEGYMRSLLDRYDEPVLLEMEAEGRERGFPIIGRLVGVTVELLARSIGAKRVFELGSGFGYSAYWFSRAVGPDGEVHGTDGDPANEPKALEYLGRAGLADPIRWHVGDAVSNLNAVDGTFDVVYNDIDKDGYPDTVELAHAHLRPGGLFISDNVLWSGRILPGHDDGAKATEGIREFTRRLFAHRGFLTTIDPTRDGVAVALKVS
jgi:predicted O-methyltransferase YrrM